MWDSNSKQRNEKVKQERELEVEMVEAEAGRCLSGVASWLPCGLCVRLAPDWAGSAWIPVPAPTPTCVSYPFRFLPQYIVKCHGNTLLPQFLGMYRVSVENEDSYMLVMRNMFSHRLPVHRKYDLKVRPG